MRFRDRLIKNLLFFSILIYYVGGYVAINWLTEQGDRFYSVMLPGEEGIPFIPEMIFPYLLIYFYVVLAYLGIDDLPFFKKVITSFFLCVTVHFIFFILFPVKYTLRPQIEFGASLITSLVQIYYWHDLPNNCFPSLHISNVFLVTFFFKRYRPGSIRWLLPGALLVSLAVVLVKQHYILDVVTGFLVGWGVERFVFGRGVSEVSPSRDVPRGRESRSVP